MEREQLAAWNSAYVHRDRFRFKILEFICIYFWFHILSEWNFMTDLTNLLGDMTEEQWKKHATQKSLDIVESFYNILKYRDAEIEKLRQALHNIGGYVMQVMQDDVGPYGATIRGGNVLEIVNKALHVTSEYSDGKVKENE